MKSLIAVSILLLFLVGCKSGKEQKEIELSDINIYLETDLEIDSILFANWTQDREFQYLPYSDTLRIDLIDSINDYYSINFFIGDKEIHSKFWLDGQEVIIKGNISNKLKIDTVIGSDLYYKSLDFRRRYKELKTQTEDHQDINNFLLEEFERNIDKNFSIEIGLHFYGINRSNKDELKKLYSLQLKQDETMKSRLDNSINRIDKILTIDKIDFSNFQFYDINGNLSIVDLEEGKKYLIDYWFVNCAPCIEQHRSIKDKLEDLKNNDIEVIGISIDQDQKEWSEFLLKEKYGWLNYRENDHIVNTLQNHLMIAGFPTYLYLDSQGTLLQRFGSFSEFEEYLENIQVN